LKDSDFIDLIPKPVPVPAKPTGLWTLVLPFVEGPALLRISASTDDRWGYAPRNDAFCFADGDPCSLVARDLCLASCAPVGALIGKIGGSSAGIDDGGMVFAVGQSCVVRVPDDGGPLYLTINDTYDGMENNGGEIHIESIQRAPAPSKPAEPDPKPPKVATNPTAASASREA
jgi:hypothetical protein